MCQLAKRQSHLCSAHTWFAIASARCTVAVASAARSTEASRALPCNSAIRPSAEATKAIRSASRGAARSAVSSDASVC